ncbi:MAG: cobalamin B12-binding domain-containing protein [Candidatus Omnitrophica bacterium]|nr:cobalamin B12-binding domain-containing protein [Candidatus Omnitrophota bacterium]
MAAVLEQNDVKCTLIDYPAQDKDWEDLEEDLKRLRPDLFLISITTPTLDRDLRAGKLAKTIRRDTLVGVKGAHFWRDNPRILLKYPMLDFAMMGEYEETIGEFVTKPDWKEVPGLIYRDQGEVHSTGKRELVQNLDDIPYPARHLIKNSVYIRPDTGELQTTIVTNRGCPENASSALPRV